MNILKIKISLFCLLLCISSIVFAEEKKYIYTDDIKISVANNNLHHLEIRINWQNLPKSEAEYIKMVHSKTDPSIVYKDGNYNWATENISAISSLTANFNNYFPDYKGVNYYRACFTTYDSIYCSKSNYKVDLSATSTNKITLEDLAKIKTFLRDNKETISFIVKSKYLSEKTNIPTDDLVLLAKQYSSFDDFKKAKTLIELISKDRKNANEIKLFLTENKDKSFASKEDIKSVVDQVDNWLDLNSRSFEELGKYDLTLENDKQLNEFKDTLKNKYENFGNTTKSIEVSRTDSVTDENEKTRNISLTANLSSDGKNVQVSDVAIMNLSYKLLGLITLIIVLYFIFSKINFRFESASTLEKKENIPNAFKENILQILKSENEYIVEYNGIYNKGVKVLEQNKNNITSSIYNYVHSVCKLQVRGMDIYEELKNMDIKIPDLKESGTTLYRLYLGENIRSSLKNQNGNEALVIKTDEPDVPWEIMHDGENFLSLKYPIARKIMTRENIRKTQGANNKKPKILFISNPTGDLAGSEEESKNIISKLGKKAEITLISGKDATSSKIFSLIGQSHWDIIHYSGHAYFDSANPDMSGLVLSDSTVTASEIKRVLNGNPLIFLNGCSSGRSDEKNFEQSGEDTTGIASSFLIGGAKGVISTLWPISDQVGADFAGVFYEQFLKNNSVGNALLRAKKDMYVAYPNDITWASFIYYGDINLTINS